MEKEKVDKIITKYVKKIYNFALSKTLDIDTAEELSAKITFEVYLTLLKTENIENINAYIYRVARNIYSKYLISEKKNSLMKNRYEINTNVYSYNSKFEYERLRKEIAYLSKMHREIIVMFYFQKYKITEIADKLNIPKSTVGRHLFDARNRIKVALQENSNHNFNQRKFSELGHHGITGEKNIEMSFYLTKNLSQNIAYISYYKPLTIVEIAKQLETPVSFIEDEVYHLVENGFMLKKQKNKYQTNMLISEYSSDTIESGKIILKKFAMVVYEKYINTLIKALESIFNTDKLIYTPQNDKNYFLWTLITFSYRYLFSNYGIGDCLEEFYAIRKGGGKNIALARVANCVNTKYKYGQPNIGLNLTLFDPKKLTNMKVWANFSKFDNRREPLKSWKYQLFETLHDFMDGSLEKVDNNINKFMKLYNTEVIVNFNNKDHVNMIVTTHTLEELVKQLPPVPNEVLSCMAECSEEIYKMKSLKHPEHIHPMLLKISQAGLPNNEGKDMLIEKLLADGIIHDLKKYQKKTVSMILFNDILPN